MALIKCPECGKEVSDKANACIYCGCPLHGDNNGNKMYSVVFRYLSYGANRAIAISRVSETLGLCTSTVLNAFKEPDSTLIDGVEQSNIDFLRDELKSYDCIVDFVPSESSWRNPENSKWSQASSRRSTQVKCPRCGSTQITTTQRGYSLITGFVGSNKTANRCAKCGYSWQPKIN